MREGEHTGGRWRSGLATVMSSFASGCVVDDYVRQDGLWALWLSLPFVTTLILGGVIVHIGRSSRLREWDLHESTADPGTGLLALYWTLVVVVCLSFPIYSFFVEAVDPLHRLYNIAFWLTGGVAGSVGGWFIGLLLAATAFKRV